MVNMEINDSIQRSDIKIIKDNNKRQMHTTNEREDAIKAFSRCKGCIRWRGRGRTPWN